VRPSRLEAYMLSLNFFLRIKTKLYCGNSQIKGYFRRQKDRVDVFPQP
jgi:hypothetical protein